MKSEDDLLQKFLRHELRNQFGALMEYVELMNAGACCSEESLKKMEIIIDTIRKLLRLGQKLSQLSGSESLLLDLIPASKLKVKTGESVSRLIVPTVIGLVLSTLLENADRHGGATECFIDAVILSDAAVIIIKDNGAGVPLEEKEKIFLEGYGKHTGFGLYVARKILSALSVSIFEDGETGARFKILLPADRYKTI